MRRRRSRRRWNRSRWSRRRWSRSRNFYRAEVVQQSTESFSHVSVGEHYTLGNPLGRRVGDVG